MKLIYCVVITLLSITFNSSAAVNIVECKDEEGNTFFSKTCPPGSTPISEKRIATGGASDGSETAPTNTTASQSSPVSATMYMIPNCSPCNGVREFFKANGLSLTEKNVEDNVELQNELIDLNGALNVPITVIGDKKLAGFNRTELLTAVKAEGWVDPAEKNKQEEQAQ